LISIDDESDEEEPDEEDRRGRRNRVNKTKQQRRNDNVLVGQTLFKEHLEKNVIIFDKCHRSTGLLPRIMDEVRNGKTTVESHKMIMHLATKFPNAPYDKGVYNDNHSRELMNMVQTVQDAERTKQPLFVSFATYDVMNKTTERFMRALKPQKSLKPQQACDCPGNFRKTHRRPPTPEHVLATRQVPLRKLKRDQEQTFRV
jgi:hypothetical protein